MKSSELQAIYLLAAIFCMGASIYFAFSYALAPESVVEAVPGMEYRLTVAELKALKAETQAQVLSAATPLFASTLLLLVLGAWWLSRMPRNSGEQREFKGAI